MTLTPDIEIHGGGVAGSVAAILLARGGCHVTQCLEQRRQRPLPPEILSPWSLTLLDRMGISQPKETARCGGVLSQWDEGEPDFHDYVLTTTRHGIAVNRASFHQGLRDSALGAGVSQIEARTGNVRQKHLAPSGGTCHLHADGRSTSTSRKFEDRLVAMFMPCGDDRSCDRLIIEAVEEGWWYLSPQVGPSRFAVLVTDYQSMPGRHEGRAEWLRASLRRTDLIATVRRDADTDQVAGMDARVATAETIAWATSARLGDAAISLDPLSGTGIARALEGAAVISMDILENGRAGERYRAWVEDTHRDEMLTRASIYERAADRFRGASFWKRRMIVLSEQLQARAT